MSCPPEPTTIYLHNRFVQYAHARCLVRELKDRENRKLPSQYWPEGFADIYQYALPGAGRPAEFDSVHRLGGGDPHLTYGLRANVETQLQIVERLENRKLGTMDLKQAIREAYPGACYLYLGQPYRVEQWKSGIQQGEIIVAKMAKAIPTQPMLEIYVDLDMTDERNGGIINEHDLSSQTGFIVEANLFVIERIIGIYYGKEAKKYKKIRTSFILKQKLATCARPVSSSMSMKICSIETLESL